MDPITQQQALAAAGAGGEALYVDDVFSTYVYEGNGTSQTITNEVDLSGEGGLVWIKKRSGVDSHALFDTERGNTSLLRSNTTDAAVTTSNGITSFNNNGFSLGSGVIGTNANGEDIVSWTFRKAPGFFDIVTYTGNDSSGTYTTTQTISHNLEGSAGMVIVRPISSTSDWYVNHDNGNPYVLKLNSTLGDTSVDEDFGFSGPGTTFKVKGPNTNANNVQYIAYVFARGNASNEIFGKNGDESIIKCGYYNGNSSSDGPEINIGWEPQFVMIKRRNQTGNWMVFDTMRGMTTLNDGGVGLEWNTSDAEAAFNYVRPTATGFKLQTTNSNVNSASGDNTYIYMAIRRPHKPATAATEVFSVTTTTNDNNFNTTGFPVDAAIASNRTHTYGNLASARLIGQKALFTHSSASQSSYLTSDAWASNTSFRFAYAGSGHSWVNFAFKRAPEFFDTVAYTGTGSATTINHNLGAVPKMIIVKKRDSTESWSVYHEAPGNTKNLWLNDSGGGITNSRWNNTTPTDSVFSVGTDTGTNSSGSPYIAYLFGDVSGISKVGSYTGTGSDIYVDCGFTAGARFVLIKRYGSSGNWYVWDTVRGIVTGNDPYVLLDTNGGEVTSTDYIDPLNAGFTVTSTAPAGLNDSGGTYLFLAIA